MLTSNHLLVNPYQPFCRMKGSSSSGFVQCSKSSTGLRGQRNRCFVVLSTHTQPERNRPPLPHTLRVSRHQAPRCLCLAWRGAESRNGRTSSAQFVIPKNSSSQRPAPDPHTPAVGAVRSHRARFAPHEQRAGTRGQVKDSIHLQTPVPAQNTGGSGCSTMALWRQLEIFAIPSSCKRRRTAFHPVSAWENGFSHHAHPPKKPGVRLRKTWGLDSERGWRHLVRRCGRSEPWPKVSIRS